MTDILTEIVAKKREEVADRERSVPLEQLKETIEQNRDKTRGFVGALKNRVAGNEAAIIAEIKKASPSKGVIREDFQPVEIAKSYEQSGAACLSVLTDEHFFQGADSYLKEARAATSLPVLRKDFTIGTYQVFEARAIGADCILLIVSVLDIEELHALHELAQSLDLDVLIEVHDRKELDAALTVSPELVGINNRNLKTFEVDLKTTLNLLDHIPDDVLVVTESGIGARQDVEMMQTSDVNCFLVGEAFMRAPDPGKAMKELFG